ncbi:MAG: hypothetical protein RBT61_03185, partial [Candidatus Kapabacteria bacterium]|nr:hypothetical protein [Candidatus Kapabacteria bacterium]
MNIINSTEFVLNRISYLVNHRLLIIVLSLSVLMVMNSCNCVPEISTPKIIAPDNYSNALLINAISDREILSAESDEIPLLVKLSYSEPDYHYQKLNAGNSYLRLIDETSKMSLFNLPIVLEKFEYYSIVFFGFGNS